jgi:hypothetical protein
VSADSAGLPDRLVGEGSPSAPAGRVPGSHFRRQLPRTLPALLAIASGNVAGLGLGLVSWIVAARALGPVRRGELVAAQTWAGTAAVLLTMGVTQALVTYRGSDADLSVPVLAQTGFSLLVGGWVGAMVIHAVQNPSVFGASSHVQINRRF